jgi:flagellar motor switch protein FliN/FliY
MHDLRCPVAALIGTGSLTMRQCLELKPGSVVTLSQQPGDDLELRVNDVLIGYGEVVIFEDSTSIRVTRIAPGDGSGE